MNAVVYLVVYPGQTESVYTWHAYTYSSAEHLLRYLQDIDPERDWEIMEKDVS